MEIYKIMFFPFIYMYICILYILNMYVITNKRIHVICSHLYLFVFQSAMEQLLMLKYVLQAIAFDANINILLQ